MSDFRLRAKTVFYCVFIFVFAVKNILYAAFLYRIYEPQAKFTNNCWTRAAMQATVGIAPLSRSCISWLIAGKALVNTWGVFRKLSRRQNSTVFSGWLLRHVVQLTQRFSHRIFPPSTGFRYEQTPRLPKICICTRLYIGPNGFYWVDH